ncbi:MAG: hypothetical protein ACOY3I_06805 [Verrucomicrobiota bacterium]
MKAKLLLTMVALAMWTCNITQADSSTLSSTLAATQFMQTFKANVDSASYTQFLSDMADYAEDAGLTSLSDSQLSNFVLSYVLKNPDFAEKAKSALVAAVKATLSSELDPDDLEKLIEKLKDGDEDAEDELIKELKKQIDELKNLSKEEREEAKKALDQLIEQNKKLLEQLANTNAGLQGLGSQLADAMKPKGMDPMLAMLIALVIMLLLGGGGGGGSCGGGGCGK